MRRERLDARRAGKTYRGGDKTHRVNVAPPPQRGGIRF